MSSITIEKQSFFDMLPDDEFVDGLLKAVVHGVLPGPMSDGRGGSALHIAAERGNAGICARLVEHGADIWMPDRANELPIHRAAAKGHLNVCKALLAAAGAERERMLDAQAGSCETPFLMAVAHGRLEMISYFVLECGEDPGQKTKVTRRALTSHRSPRAMDDVAALLLSLASEMSIRSGIDPEGTLISQSSTRQQPGPL